MRTPAIKKLLIVSAWLEAATGGALMASPAQPVSLLLGTALDRAGGLVLARVAGGALLALGLACWRARDARQDRGARGIVAAMLLYNAVVAAVLVHAGLGFRLSGIGLWPAVVLHLALAVWCIACLRPMSQSRSEPTMTTAPGAAPRERIPNVGSR